MCIELRAVWKSRGSAGGSPDGGTPEGWRLWAESGHVIREQQLLLPRPPPLPSSSPLSTPGGRSYAALLEGLPAQMLRMLPPRRSGGTPEEAPSSSPPKLHVVRGDGGAAAEGDVVISEPDGTQVVISAATGCLSSLTSGGCGSGADGGAVSELLASPLQPCLWRALTDNDRGGSGGTSYGARWAAAGLDRMEVFGEQGVCLPPISPLLGAGRCALSLIWQGVEARPPAASL